MKTHALLSALAASLTTLLGAYSAHACWTTTEAQSVVDTYAAAHTWIGSPTPTHAIVPQGTTGWKQAYTNSNANIWLKMCGGPGAHIVQGTIEDHYVALGGGATSQLGYPETDEAETVSGDGRFSTFETGGIFFETSTAHTFAVQGYIWDRYYNMNTTLSGLGYPTANEAPFSNSFFSGAVSDMENGFLVFDSSLGSDGWLMSTWPVFNVLHSASGIAAAASPYSGGATVSVSVVSGFGNNSNVFLYLDNWTGRSLMQTGVTSATGTFSFSPQNLLESDAGGGSPGFPVATFEVVNSTFSQSQSFSLEL